MITTIIKTLVGKSGKPGKGMRRSSGQAIIEFALVLPIFILIFVGVVEFGRMIYTKHMLDKAVREGAREGAVVLDPEEAERTALEICNLTLASVGIDSDAHLSARIVKVEGRDAIRVEASYPFRSFFTEGQFAVIPFKSLTATATMRKEG